MEKLPYEIRVRIFWSLPFRSKYSCLFVSKDWNAWVKSSFYSDISFQHECNLTDAMRFFEEHSQVATHVKYIKIRQCSNLLAYFHEFPHYFTHLKKLILRSDDHYFSFRDTPRKPLEPSAFPYLKEVVTSESVVQLAPLAVEEILKHKCPHLIQVSTGITEPLRKPSARDVFLRIFRSLENAPQLSTLVLFSLYCDVTELDILHTYAPRLTSLTFFCTKFMLLPDKQVNHQRVHLEHLDVHFSSDAVRQSEEMVILATCKYIGEKYEGLRRLSITAEHSTGLFSQFDVGAIEQSMLALIARCPQLVLYDVMLCPITQAITQQMDAYGIQLESVAVFLDMDTVEDQFNALLSSNQCMSIKCLSVIKVDQDTFFDDEDDDDVVALEMVAIEKLTQMQRLQGLSLQSDVDSFCLSVMIFCLNELPRLTRLSICNVKAKYQKEYPTVTKTVDVKKIEINMLEAYCDEEADQISDMMAGMLPQCPDLEHFVLKLELEEQDELQQEVTPFTIVLDFTQQTKLKSLDITANSLMTSYFKIVRHDRPESDGYYYYHDRMSCVDRIDGIPSTTVCYTTILLGKSVLLNSTKI